MGGMYVFIECYRLLTPLQDIVDVGEQGIALGNCQWLIHTTRHSTGTVNAPTGNRLDDLLSVFA